MAALFRLTTGIVYVRSWAGTLEGATLEVDTIKLDDANADVILVRDAANTLAQRNGTTAQVSRIYNTFTDASNGEWCAIKWLSNVLYIGDEYNGTGSPRTVQIGALGSGQASVKLQASGTAGNVALATNGSDRWQVQGDGPLVASADNSYDIGASGATRPRDTYIAGRYYIGGSGTATSASKLTKKVTGIADNTATDVLTVTIPNANHAAAIKLTFLSSNGSTDAFESSRVATGHVVVARTTGVVTVTTAAAIDDAAIATVAAGATHTLAYNVSAVTGAAGASNSFTIQVTIDDSGNLGSNQIVVLAEIINAEATGITIS
mgnify:CR=1 FL=1